MFGVLKDLSVTTLSLHFYIWLISQVAELEGVEELATSPDMEAAKKVMEEAIEQFKAE